MLRQFVKFGLVGTFNTFLDLGILNFLIFSMKTGEAGFMFSLFKAISFLCAATSSYFLNKFWVFREPSKKKRILQFSKFFIITIVGGLINITTATIVVTFILPRIIPFLGTVDKRFWPTMGGLCGTAAGMFWNFFGYKFLVFKEAE